jgi:hypothetical protein
MAAFLTFPAVWAAPPSSIRVQGSLSDRSGGTPVPANGTFQMTFRLYDDAIAGTLLATSGPAAVQVSGGLYNADAAFPPAAFNAPNLFLEVQVAAEVLTPRIPVASVPYAYVAAQSASVAPGGVTTASIAPGAVTPDKLALPCTDGQLMVQIHGATSCIWPSDVQALCRPGDTKSCFGGPANACGTGTAGTMTCTGGTMAGVPCVGWIPPRTPEPEICDGIDNDSNGIIDDNAVHHSNGMGGTYATGCTVSLGTPGDASTYTAVMANSARSSWTPPDGLLFDNNFACNGGNALERASPTQCVTWIYSGPSAGHVNITNGTTGTCCSASGTDSTWN